MAWLRGAGGGRSAARAADALGNLRETQDFAGFPLPVLASIDWITAAIALAAMIAMFRFKVGALPTLAFGALAGAATLLL